MELKPKYQCYESYRGKPGQAMQIAEMIRAHADPDACLEWPHKRKPSGYGVVRHKGRDWRVHRLAYMIAVGDIPCDLIVLHSCDNPPCFNPRHLSLGTRTDNANDRNQKGRTAGPHSPWKGPRGQRLIVAGERNAQSKLTEDKVREIRHRYKSGVTQSAIAAEYGVNQTLISAVVNRRAWKHVNP